MDYRLAVIVILFFAIRVPIVFVFDVFLAGIDAVTQDEDPLCLVSENSQNLMVWFTVNALATSIFMSKII